ncbi:type IV pilus modification PilV family protein [Arcobacter arenosus]|uniref:Type II secretion system protein n=1 Tax=Arcobacter arenosus TaxID=2576037 RepID=A0A5R8Y4J6_9BACT|nr:hypothetical protein [Arcobacter arenosus]TLP40888.1 hypothetical protein FDK22_02395 [Arcobacter arenosus]
MEKNSFTLFETLVSVFLLSIVIVGFSKVSNYDNFDEEYMKLNELENSFNTNTYSSNFTNSTENIKILINDSQIENLNVKKIENKNEKINLFKYELN